MQLLRVREGELILLHNNMPVFLLSQLHINAPRAHSDHILLRTIRQFTSGPAQKHFQPRVPAEGECIKAPDLRL